MTSGDTIAEFWSAWPELRGMLELDLSAGGYGSGTEKLAELVDAIDPGLEWDLLSGARSRQALCLSSAADPALRSVTERWVRQAPAPDGDWEYHPARIPVVPANLTVGDLRIRPQDVTVAVEMDPVREELNVTIGHPDFAGLDEVLQLQVAFRLLDDLLGEDAMEMWIGAVEVAPGALRWGKSLLDLAEEVAHLANTATGQRWEHREVDDDDLGSSRLFMNYALKRLSNLSFEFLAMVNIEVGSRDHVLVREIEKDLAVRIGKLGVIYAHQVFPQFTVLYAYVSEEAAGAVRRLSIRWAPHVYNVTVDPDSGWETFEDLANA